MLTFGNRVAIVTGGTKNIGLAIVKEFLNVGLKVAVVSSNEKNVKSTIEQFSDKDVLGIVADLRDLKNIDKIINKTVERFNGIDIIVNNAGILDMSSIEESNEKIWDDVLNINLKASFFLVQKALPYLKKAQYPRIINIASNAGRMGGFANGVAYTASKGGLIALTYGLARRLACFKITVNCVAPGTIESDMLNQRDEETKRELLKNFPLRCFGKPDDVANAVLYFASIESSFTTGAVLDVNGGLFMG